MIIYEEILWEFQKKKVEYILVEMTDKNLFKIVEILKKAGYHVRQPVYLIAKSKTVSLYTAATLTLLKT